MHESQIARYQNLMGQVRCAVLQERFWCCITGCGTVPDVIRRGSRFITSSAAAFRTSDPRETSDLDDSDLRRWRPIFHGPPSTVPDSIPKS